jgi:hypothetical protein
MVERDTGKIYQTPADGAQITLPKAFFEKVKKGLGWTHGDKLVIEINKQEKKLIITKL